MNAATPVDDTRLLAAIATGDQVAFAEFYDRHARPCHSLARRITVDRGLAEDAVQEAFLAAWRQAASYSESRGNARSWLVSLAHHKAVDMVRRQHGARQARLEDLAELDTQSADTASPDEHAWREVRRDRVIDALGGLSAVQREVLVLAYIGGYSYSEIAAAIEVPLGTVKTRAHAAVHRLRAQLQDIAD